MCVHDDYPVKGVAIRIRDDAIDVDALMDSLDRYRCINKFKCSLFFYNKENSKVLISARNLRKKADIRIENINSYTYGDFCNSYI